MQCDNKFDIKKFPTIAQTNLSWFLRKKWEICEACYSEIDGITVYIQVKNREHLCYHTDMLLEDLAISLSTKAMIKVRVIGIFNPLTNLAKIKVTGRGLESLK